MSFPDISPLLQILAALHTLITLWLALYGLHSWALLVLFWVLRRRPKAAAAKPLRADSNPLAKGKTSGDDFLPSVTVQIPIYNERHVVRRIIDATANLDYPRDRLEIQVLDDSTDETTRIAEARAAFWRERGVNIRVLHRPDRSGFKAGALAWGLTQARGELIAVFDADFCPRPDFLKQVVPYFQTDPRLGMVQTRWSHLNADYSIVTCAQAMALDGHFAVEQTARSQAGLLMHFNGTGGVWRRACIEESGGWQSDTVCEDLDLSYRAQLRGWRALYLPDVDCPGELPPQVLAFKQQQARWAKGSVQCLRKLARPLLLSRTVGPIRKFCGLLHLSGYLVHPLMILLLLLTPAVLVVPSPLGEISRVLGIVCLGPILSYVTSQWALYPDWIRRLRAFPAMALIGTGIAWNNSRAILEGLTHWGGTFIRTPKFRLEGRRGNWQRSHYRLTADWSVLGEIGLAIYALGVTGMAWTLGKWGIVPFLLLYVGAFGLVAGLSLRETWAPRPQRRGRFRSSFLAPPPSRSVRPSEK
ncbi:MAG: glycosyltransferase [Anaerolineae bacterium]|nr:glycosyltransferase [Anaerolineae bacterium]